MLDFWYSDRCTRQIKLMACVGGCSIIFLSSKEFHLLTYQVLTALVLGAIYHLIHYVKQKLKADHPYKKSFQMILFTVPLVGIIGLISTLPNEGRLYLTIQILGFAAIGFFLITIYSNRTKKSDQY